LILVTLADGLWLAYPLRCKVGCFGLEFSHLAVGQGLANSVPEVGRRLVFIFTVGLFRIIVANLGKLALVSVQA
jgi:hypothetical protein